jgi:hypothetical protein
MNFDELLELFSQRQPLAPLFPQTVWRSDLCHTIAHTELNDTTRAGLLLWNDDLEQSHTLSQGISSPTGSLWHAVMHRREGDASNSVYWWRKTGAHPAFEVLYQRAVDLLQNETNADAQTFLSALQRAKTWLPEEFVRACQSNADWCERMQHLEFKTFVEYSHTH